MNDRDKQLLNHIKNHFDEMNETLELIGDSYEKFSENKMVSKSVMMDVFQIGENINSLSDSCKSKILARDLRGIIDIRNHIAHGYIYIDGDTIWDTIHKDIPRLIGQLEEQVND